jgi:dTMP kinase
MFFSFDGVDGVGKTTQLGMFCEWLAISGHAVMRFRDPGSTPLGEVVRNLLLEKGDTPIHRRSEMLLYMAARAQLVEELIRPALAQGKVVVCDRYLLANVVYQGHAGGLEPDAVWRVGEIATASTHPELTFLLDMDVDAASERIQRTLDRIESRGIEFLRRVRHGYLEEAARLPTRVVVIDAAADVVTVQSKIRAAARAKFAQLSQA